MVSLLHLHNRFDTQFFSQLLCHMQSLYHYLPKHQPFVSNYLGNKQNGVFWQRIITFYPSESNGVWPGTVWTIFYYFSELALSYFSNSLYQLQPVSVRLTRNFCNHFLNLLLRNAMFKWQCYFQVCFMLPLRLGIAKFSYALRRMSMWIKSGGVDS